MAYYPLPATLAADGTASISFSHNKVGLVWIVSQIGVQTTVVNPGSTVKIYLNGFFVSGSAVGSGDAASGPPAITLHSSDILRCDWTGGTAGTSALATIMYTEWVEGSMPRRWDVV